MKLIYISPNLGNIIHHISNILGEDVSYTNSSLMNSCLIIKVSKKGDMHLLEDMCNFILGSLNQNMNIVSVETQYSYYMSMTLCDVITILSGNQDNLFIRGLGNVLERSNIHVSDGPDINRSIGGEIINYILPYHDNHSIQVLNDMLYLGKDFIVLLERNSDLSREDLIKLYRFTVRMRVPIYLSRELMRDIRLCIDVDYKEYYNDLKYEMDDIDTEPIKFTLDKLIGKSGTNINPGLVDLTMGQDRLLSFMIRFIKSIKNRIDVSRFLPTNTYTDIIMTLSIEDLIKLQSQKTKKYINYINGLTELLLYNNYHMEFIINDRRKI